MLNTRPSLGCLHLVMAVRLIGLFINVNAAYIISLCILHVNKLGDFAKSSRCIAIVSWTCNHKIRVVK